MLHRYSYRILLLLLFLVFTNNIFSQKLPKKIRGYKVHYAKVSVRDINQNEPNKKRLRVETDFDEPEFARVGLYGISIELNSKLTVYGKSGKIDFIAFKDFTVNGIKVDIEEYRESFEFKKAESFELKEPVEIFISTRQTLRGALKEYKNSKEKWLVKGRVFVFGKFRKFGFKFKRVIPVDVELSIDNPLKKK